MRYYDGDMFFNGFGVFMFVFLVLLLIAVIVLVVWGVQHSKRIHEHPSVPPFQHPDSACEIARVRYAKGEISKEEFDEICKTLNV
jgi:putative membrane protein